MKKIIYVMIGVLIGLLVSLLLFQPRLDYFLDDESELIDNEMKIYDDDDDDDDDDDYEINRVEYYKDKLVIKLSDDEIDDADFIISYEEKLKKYINKNKINHIKFFEIEDKFFENRMKKFSKDNSLEITFYQTPMFLETREEFEKYSNDKKFLSHANFYKQIRKKLNILIDENQEPIGSKWSFDDENRKKIPNNIELPRKLENSKSKYISIVSDIITDRFNDHPGEISNIWMPLTRSEALKI